MLALLFCIDTLPYRSRVQTSGGSLRSNQFVQKFSDQGFETRVAIPKDTLLTSMQRHLLDGSGFLFFDIGSEAEIIAETKPDIIVWMWPLVAQVPICPAPGIISVVDLNGFQNVESASASGQSLKQTTKALLNRARHADVVVYGSHEQRAYWEGLYQLDYPIDKLPIGFVLPYFEPAALARPYNPQPKNFYYVGSFLPWLNPFDALFVLADEVDGTDSHLCIFPSTQPMDTQSRYALDRLVKRKNVIVEAPLSSDKLYARIGFAGIAFDVLSDTFERRFALPIRTINYLTYGIPLIYNDYNSLSRDIVSAGAGWATANNEEALRTTIRCVLNEGDRELTLRSEAAAALADRAFACRENWREFAACLRETRPSRALHARRLTRDTRKLNVLVISDDGDNLLNLRLISPLEVLVRKNEIGGFVVVGRDGIRRSTFAAGEDPHLHTVVVQRAPVLPSVAVLELTGGVFNYDIDDNLLAQPSYRPPFPPDIDWKVRTYLSQASTITVTNAFLARALATCSGIDVAGRARIVPNPLLTRSRGISCKSVANVMFASSDNLPLTDSAAQVFSAVGAFCRRHKFGFLYLGPYPEHPVFKEYLNGVDICNVATRSYNEYLEFVEGSDTIAITPLETRGDPATVDFVRSKSDIKAVEYLGLGRPAIFSNAAPYRYSDLSLPFVVPNEQQSWEAALEAAAIQSVAQRRELASDVEDRRWIGGHITGLWRDYLHLNELHQPLRLSRVTETLHHSLSNLRFALHPALFDGAYYLRMNEDVRRCVGDKNIEGAYEHYLNYGRAEGRQASQFDTGRSMQHHLEETISIVQGLDGELNDTDQAIMRIKRKIEGRKW